MKAVVFKDTRRVAVEEVPDAVIEAPTDVVIKVTSSAICGTDLHMYDGRTGATPGLVLGHEPLGVIMETGSAVELVKPGDRVVIPTHLFCGLCFNCIRGYTAHASASVREASALPTATRAWVRIAERRPSFCAFPMPMQTASSYLASPGISDRR